MERRRSVYADRLGEYAEFVFEGDEAGKRRGRWGEFFARRVGAGFSGKVVLEVGCGDVSLLEAMARKWPGVGFVGVDWKYRALYHGAGRIAEAEVRNVALVRGRGQEIGELFAEGELDEVWVFHPDPCDGKGGEHEYALRLVSEKWLGEVARALRPGGSFVLKTDHPGYWQAAMALFGAQRLEWMEEGRKGDRAGLPKTKWGEVVGPEALPAASEAVGGAFEVVSWSTDFWGDEGAQAAAAGRGFAGEVTGFESRFRKRGLPIYYLEARRK